MRRISSTRFPYLDVKLWIHRKSFNVTALLDTGFDGGIIVPQRFVAHAESLGSSRWTLADGSRVFIPAYAGTLQIGSMVPFHVPVLALGKKSMLGRFVIDRFKVTFDHGRRVILEP